MKRDKHAEHAKRTKKRDDLDTETTFANMNVEGFRWYKPESEQDRGGEELPPLSRGEKRALRRAAISALFPAVGFVILFVAVLFGLAYLWLK